jgi:hypothetical protein
MPVRWGLNGDMTLVLRAPHNPLTDGVTFEHLVRISSHLLHLFVALRPNYC